MSWTYEPIGKLYGVHNGLSKPAKFFGRGFPFASFKDVFRNTFLPSELSGLVESDEKEQFSYSLRRGDILITRTSETYDELGMSSVALKDYPHATYNGFSKRLRPLDSSLLPEFIGYYMRSPEFRQNFLQFSQMTTRASLRNENLLSISVPVPPMAEQERIAKILRNYDSLIENNRKQIKLLEEAAQRLYKEWFIDLRFPGHEDAKIDPETCLPDGWKQYKVQEVYPDITIGKTPSRERKDCFVSEGVPWFSVSDLGQEGQFAINSSESLTEEAIDEFNVKIVPAGTILLSFKLTLGRVSITTQDSATNEAIAHFRPTSSALRNYTYLYLKEFPYETLGSTSSISKAINSKIVKSIPFVLPNEEVLSEFDSIVAPLFNSAFCLRKQIEAALEARNRLLTKFMEGEVEL